MSKPFLEVLQSNVLPMLKVGTAYAGIFIIGPRNKITSKLVTGRECYFVCSCSDYFQVQEHMQEKPIEVEVLNFSTAEIVDHNSATNETKKSGNR